MADWPTLYDTFENREISTSKLCRQDFCLDRGARCNDWKCCVCRCIRFKNRPFYDQVADRCSSSRRSASTAQPTFHTTALQTTTRKDSGSLTTLPGTQQDSTTVANVKPTNKSQITGDQILYVTNLLKTLLPFGII